MRSKAHIKSHPLHPILIPFPIAFFTGTLLFHILGWLGQKPDLLQTAYYLNLAGVGFALLAAIPGLIDFIYTVPPNSSGKKRAAQHGITNTIVLLLFTAAWFYRRGVDADHFVLSAIEVLGTGLMLFAGWLGGTLVHRNQIGIDHRYANAGKWKEAYLKKGNGPIEVAATDELNVNALKLLHVDGKRIALGRTENGYVAFDDRCTHRGASQADGVLICGTVHCPWHGSHFDVETGAVKAGPATEGIATYRVEEREGKVFLLL